MGLGGLGLGGFQVTLRPRGVAPGRRAAPRLTCRLPFAAATVGGRGGQNTEAARRRYPGPIKAESLCQRAVLCWDFGLRIPRNDPAKGLKRTGFEHVGMSRNRGGGGIVDFPFVFLRINLELRLPHQKRCGHYTWACDIQALLDAAAHVAEGEKAAAALRALQGVALEDGAVERSGGRAVGRSGGRRRGHWE